MRTRRGEMRRRKGGSEEKRSKKQSERKGSMMSMECPRPLHQHLEEIVVYPSVNPYIGVGASFIT